MSWHIRKDDSCRHGSATGRKNNSHVTWQQAEAASLSPRVMEFQNWKGS